MHKFNLERQRLASFFGRDDVFDALDRLVFAAKAPRNHGYILISGGPGIGKSAIMSNYIDHLDQKKVHVAFHFIRRGVEDWATPDAILDSISGQLLEQFKNLESNPTTKFRDLLQEISTKELHNTQQRLVILVDGLDEIAKTLDGENPLHRILPRILPPNVFFLCAARPHSYLNWMKGLDSFYSVDLDGTPWLESNQDACIAFWKNQQFDPPLTAQFIEAAIRNGERNILYAVKLSEWLEGRQPENRTLELIPSGLAGVLDKIWNQLSTITEKAEQDLILDGLGILCTVREALRIEVLSAMLEQDFRYFKQLFLQYTRPFLLETTKKFRPYHASFQEFVVDELGNLKINRLHKKILQTIAAWPEVEEPTWERQYALRYGLRHCIDCEDWEGFSRRICDPNFLSAKCTDSQRGLDSLKDDLLLGILSVPFPEQKNKFQELLKAIQQETLNIQQYPESITTILYNRLRSNRLEEEEVEEILGIRGTELPLKLRFPVYMSGDEEYSLTGHANYVRSLCASRRNEMWFISGSEDKSLQMWSARTGQKLMDFSGYDTPIRACTTDQTEQVLIAGGANGMLMTWDRKTGTLNAEPVSAHEKAITACAVSPDNRYLITASKDNTLKVWNLDTLKEVRRLVGHQKEVTDCVFVPGTTSMISASGDGTLKMWDWENGQEQHSFLGHQSSVRCCTITSDGNTLISGSKDGHIKIWDIGNGSEPKTLLGHSGPVSCCVVSPDDKTLVTGSWDGRIKVWDLKAGSEKTELRGHTGIIRTCAMLSDNQTILSGADDKTVKLWDLEKITTRPKRKIDSERNMVSSCAIAANGQVLVSSSGSNIRIFNPTTNVTRNILEGHSGLVTSCAVTPDGKYVATGSEDQSVKVWDLTEEREITSFRGHDSMIKTTAITPDGSMVVSGSDDSKLKVWDVQSGEVLNSFEKHRSAVTCCTIFPDDLNLIVSGATDRSLRVWNLSNGEEEIAFTGHKGSVVCCDVSPDGKTIMSGSDDGELIFWSFLEKRMILRLQAHESRVSSCKFSSNGKFFVTCSKERKVKVWNRKNHTCIATAFGISSFYGLDTVDQLICAGDETGNLWILDAWYGDSTPQANTQAERKSLPLRAFISYADSDEDMKEHFIRHLSGLVNQGKIIHWDSRLVFPGEDWVKEISERLQSSDLIFQLISADFIASHYGKGTEWSLALQLHRTKKARIIPIILRACVWKDLLPEGIQVLPKNETAVQLWQKEDEGWTSVVKGIRAMINEFTEGTK